MRSPESFVALYNKYRPKLFAQVVGQRHVVRILQNSLAHNRVSHAYMFSGERGTGKTTVARLLAKAVNCLRGVQPEPCNSCANCLISGSESYLDLIEIDAASNTSVDDIRALREGVRYRPTVSRYKVYLIDEVHQLSRAAYNAFLKTLEEPPEHAIFILATTDPHRVLQTVRSRCQHLRFRRHSHADMVGELARIAAAEGAVVTDDALHLIARSSEGSLRDAIGLMDQALSYAEAELTEGVLREMLGLTGIEAVASLAAAIATGAAGRALQLIDAAVQSGVNPATLQQELVDYFRGLLLVRTGRMDQNLLQFSEAETNQMAAQAKRFRVGQLVRCLELFTEGGASRRVGYSPQLDLELAAALACLFMAGDAAGPEGEARPEAQEAVEEGSAALAAEERPAATPAASRPDGGDPPASASPAERPTAEGEVDMEAVRAAVREWNPLYASYFHQATGSRQGDVVTFEFNYPSHHDSMAKDENLQRLETIVKRLVGKNVRVKCRLAEKPSAAQGGTEAQNRLVEAAVNMFGAEVIED